MVIDTPEALKASVGSDRVQLRTLDDDAAIQALSEHFGLDATLSEEAVTFYVPGGKKFVPQLFAELGVPISSVSIARPTLDDVFMTYTGRTIRDAEVSATDRMAASPWMRAATRDLPTRAALRCLRGTGEATHPWKDRSEPLTACPAAWPPNSQPNSPMPVQPPVHNARIRDQRVARGITPAGRNP